MRIKLDGTDRKILELLQTNSNITNAQLAQEIGLSPAPTLERVKKLENSEVIRSYHAVIDPSAVGMGVSTFVTVSLKGHNKDNIERFIKAIKDIEEVIECHHVTGADSLVLKVVATSVRHLEVVIETLGRWGTPATSIILSSPVDGRVVSEPPAAWQLMKAALRKAATTSRPGSVRPPARARPRAPRRP